MQGSNENCLQMKGHTRGGEAPTVLPFEHTHRGGTHTQYNPTNRHTNFFGHTKQTNKQTKRTKYILRQHAA